MNLGLNSGLMSHQLGNMETGPQFKVSSARHAKCWMELVIPELVVQSLIHFVMATLFLKRKTHLTAKLHKASTDMGYFGGGPIVSFLKSKYFSSYQHIITRYTSNIDSFKLKSRALDKESMLAWLFKRPILLQLYRCFNDFLKIHMLFSES